MGAEPSRVEDLLGAILDGTPIDWGGLEHSAPAEARELLPYLKIVAEVARAHSSDRTPATGSASAASAEDSAGTANQRWGGLVLMEQVGQGSFGEVYRAWDPRLAREVALKLLRRAESAQSPRESMAIEEGRLLARVRHPNVVTVHGADRIDGRVGIWMEFLRGRTLGDLVRANGPFSTEEAVRIGVDLCGALAAVHGAGLLHRDIKAQNVIREEGGRIVLMDFGAGQEEQDSSARRAGTPLYLAPEVVGGEPASSRSDLYGLGVLLYHLVTGKYPVAGRTMVELRDAYERGALSRLREQRPDLEAPFVRIVDRALEPDPARRFESAAAMGAALAECASPAAPTERAARRKPARIMLDGRPWLAIAAATGATVAALWASRPDGSRDGPPPFHPRDWILVATFDNRTGEARLDGTIEYALERELSVSRFVNVVPRERIHDTLRLMKRPLGARVDATVAREVCLRDGGVSALLTGRIERLGARYSIAARAVEPVSGEALAQAAEEAADEGQILRAVRSLSDEIRLQLGESRGTVARQQPLDRVTTPSLRALELYSRAMGLISHDHALSDWRSASALLEQAVAEDRQFASGYTFLAWMLLATGRPREEYLPRAERAFQLAQETTDRERYFILGSYYDMAGRKEQAIAAYETLTRLYPDHYWGLNNLAAEYADQGRPDEELALRIRLAKLRPRSYVDNAQAAAAVASSTGDLAGARTYVDRAAAVELDEHANRPGSLAAWIELFPAFQRWVEGDVEGAARAVEASRASIGRQPQSERDWFAFPVMQFELLLGRIVAAENTVQMMTGVEEGLAVPMALVALARGDEEGARETIRKYLAELTEPRARAIIGAHLGLFDEMRRVQRGWERNGGRGAPRYWHAHLGILRGAGRVGEGPDGVPILTESLLFLRANGGGMAYSIGTEALATAWMRQGEMLRAQQVLEAAGSRYLAFGSPALGQGGIFWMRLRLLLADVYRRLDREKDAQAIEMELRTLLALADPDHVILRELKARQ